MKTRCRDSRFALQLTGGNLVRLFECCSRAARGVPETHPWPADWNDSQRGSNHSPAPPGGVSGLCAGHGAGVGQRLSGKMGWKLLPGSAQGIRPVPYRRRRPDRHRLSFDESYAGTLSAVPGSRGPPATRRIANNVPPPKESRSMEGPGAHGRATTYPSVGPLKTSAGSDHSTPRHNRAGKIRWANALSAFLACCASFARPRPR
jgi:hypothetical protein